MKELPLTKGQVALIDDEDWERVAQHSWSTAVRGNTNYAHSRIKGKLIYLHRFIMQPDEAMKVDHINGNGLDNRRSNLRLATHAQNLFNAHRRNCRQCYRGVTPRKNCNSFMARIMVGGKQLHLGSFGTAIEAAVAYDKKAREIFGEYANLNFPGQKEGHE